MSASAGGGAGAARTTAQLVIHVLPQAPGRHLVTHTHTHSKNLNAQPPSIDEGT